MKAKQKGQITRATKRPRTELTLQKLPIEKIEPQNLMK